MDSLAIFYCLKALRPNDEWALNGDDYEDILWLSDGSAPSLEEIKTTWTKIRRDIELVPIRDTRDRLLKDCDWTQVNDAPVDQKAWAAYRQALRDLPATITDPTQPVDWPEPPK